VFGEEPAIDAILPHQHMQHRESEGRIAAREELQVQIGFGGGRMAHRVDDDLPGPGFLQPMAMLVRSGG
jgi:hypothetical protein